MGVIVHGPWARKNSYSGKDWLSQWLSREGHSLLKREKLVQRLRGTVHRPARLSLPFTGLSQKGPQSPKAHSNYGISINNNSLQLVNVLYVSGLVQGLRTYSLVCSQNKPTREVLLLPPLSK